MRLVKGAYWDAEIKRGQERGLPGYPLYTRKPNTDVSYLACARYVFDEGKDCCTRSSRRTTRTRWRPSPAWRRQAGLEFEFQRLHGMGEELYTHVTDPSGLGIPCRVYAPVGEHEDLLPYLVRRLLENGSNTSFVNRIVNENEPIDAIIADPVRTVDAFEKVAHPRIPQPLDIYQPERRNSLGVHLRERRRVPGDGGRAWNTCRVGLGGGTAGRRRRAERVDRHHPQPGESCRRRRQRGQCRRRTTCAAAIDIAVQAQPAWDATPAAVRGDALDKAADLFEESTAELVAMCVREAGKSVPDGIAEVREAVDFLRYYAARARHEFAGPQRCRDRPARATN